MEDEREIGKALHVFSRKIKRRMDRAFAEFGLTGEQARVLGFICHETMHREVFQKDIEEAFEIRRSSVTSILQLLERKGYIERMSVCQDARLKKLVLTEQGMEVEKTAYHLILKIEETLKEALTPEEEEVLFCILDKLSKVTIE